MVFAVPTGVAVRAIAPLIKHKKEDPAVVVLDVVGRFAISLLSGHEGGANDLALAVGNILGAEPVITTTTEALKTVIVGVGCRRGASAQKIQEAVEAALQETGIDKAEVRCWPRRISRPTRPGSSRRPGPWGFPTGWWTRKKSACPPDLSSIPNSCAKK